MSAISGSVAYRARGSGRTMWRRRPRSAPSTAGPREDWPARDVAAGNAYGCCHMPGGDKRTPPCWRMRPQRPGRRLQHQGSCNGSREARPAPPGHGGAKAMRTRRGFAAVAVRYLRTHVDARRRRIRPAAVTRRSCFGAYMSWRPRSVMWNSPWRLADIGPIQQAPGQGALSASGTPWGLAHFELLARGDLHPR